jgi:hypothetical protein
MHLVPFKKYQSAKKPCKFELPKILHAVNQILLTNKLTLILLHPPKLKLKRTLTYLVAAWPQLPAPID